MPIGKKNRQLGNRGAGALPRSRKAEPANPLSARFNTQERKSGSEPETRDLSVEPEDLSTQVLQEAESEQLPGDFRAGEEILAGWLVVIAGPGRGSSLALIRGTNTLGRGIDQQVSLDFGDTEIALENHSLISYDPAARSFWLENGSGKSDTWLAGERISAPMVLKTGDQFRVGQTVLHFVALCGESFDW